MQIFIWGVTQLGKYLVNHIEDSDNAPVRPAAFIDNNVKLQNTFVEEVPVISSNDLIENYALDKIIILLAVKSAKHIFQILEQIGKTDINYIGIVKPSTLLLGMSVKPENGSREKAILWSVFGGKRYQIIPRTEVNLIDACNLKCKGCTHFSSIYKEDSTYPVADYISDLKQIRKAGQFLRLRLLGGEPFLLKNLDEYVRITREIFPETDIEIVTNGILIPNVSGQVLSGIKEHDAIVAISPYVPTLNNEKLITERLEENGILWQFAVGEVTEFSRGLTLQGSHDAKQSCEACSSAQCAFLRNGRLYKCPIDGLINDFYEYYGLNTGSESGTDIYKDEKILYDRVMEYITKPIELCKYCAEKPELIPWSVEPNPSLEDWLYHDGCVNE